MVGSRMFAIESQHRYVSPSNSFPRLYQYESESELALTFLRALSLGFTTIYTLSR